MNLPKDPVILLSFVNTQLRDNYASLEELCKAFDADATSLCATLAYGAKTYKLKFGHRGGNHPVKNLATGKIEITSQNHSYAVDEKTIAPTGLTVTHINLLDHTVEGVECEKDRIFSVQYHPESAPGPQDSKYLFAKFIQYMKEAKENA